MAFRNKELAVGDILTTGIGEMYVYLGYYEGTPRSFYRQPDSGYLYLYIGDFDERLAIEDPDKALSYVGGELVRLRMGIDGNACYTKSYKTFEEKIGHACLESRMSQIQYCFGMKRVGDKKPSKGKATSPSGMESEKEEDSPYEL